MHKVMYVIVVVFILLVISGCGKSERQPRYQLPDKIEHPEPGSVSYIEPKMFVDSVNAGVSMDIYYLLNYTPEEQQYMVDIRGMRQIPLGDIFYAAETLSTDKPLYLICLWGDDSKRVAEKLKIDGFDSYYLDGGAYRLWQEVSEHGWKIPTSTDPNLQ